MKKSLLSLAFISLAYYSHAQVGVGTNSPNSTLTVEGSLETAYKEVSANTTLTAADHYVTFSGSTAGTITLPAVGSGITSFTGRIYRIKNVSTANVTLAASSGNTLRAQASPVSTFTLQPGTYVEVVNNASATAATWDISFVGVPSNTNVEIYGTQLKIPPHNLSTFQADFTNHSITKYDTPATATDAAWWVISKTSTDYSHSASYTKASKMTIVYEYQGTPFNLANMYPMLTAGNDQSFPDLFNANFVTLKNDGTSNRTRLTVVVSRADFTGNDTSNNSNWGGTFLLNVLLAKKIN